jgi:pilus assembly protein FimV
MVAEEPGFFDDLFDDPTMTAVLGGLLVALCGPVFYLIRKRKKNAAHVDSAFLESRLQPDSFFGASGGQRVDTSSEGASSGSSMVYSTSQLDAADDVDPVAEADVYMAYGRDVQAEEILKEALRVNPARLAIHTKLLEILAKRRDTVGYAALAEQALKLTGSQAPEWARICEVGLGFDPTNSLYQPGGIAEGGQAPAASLAAQPKAAGVPSGRDLDLDLDFSLDDEPASAISDVTGGKVTPMAASEQTTRMEAVSDSAASAGLDFDISGPMELNTPAPLPEISLSMDGFDMPVESSAAPSNAEFDSTGTSPIALDLPPVEPKTDPGMLEFDMGSLSLDLETPPKDADSTQSQSMDTTGEDPLETKLALAEEFISIGDEDGARALIEEVLSEATGDIRAKAQRALSNLS